MSRPSPSATPRLGPGPRFIRRLLSVLGMTSLFLLFVFSFRRQLGPAIGGLSAIPIVILAWWLGARWAILSGLILGGAVVLFRWAASDISLTPTTVLLSLILGPTVGVVVGRLSDQERKLRAIETQLTDRVQEQTQQLSALVADLQAEVQVRTQAEATVRRLNTELEDRVADLHASQAALQRRVEHLNTLIEISRSVAALSDIETTYAALRRQIQQVMPLDALQIALYDPYTGQVTFPLVLNPGRHLHAISTPLDPGTPMARVLTLGEAVLVNHTPAEIEQQRQTYPDLASDKTWFSASKLFVPMRAGGHLLGLVAAHSDTLNAYDQEDLALLHSAANQIGIALENARLYEALTSELAERQHAEQTVRRLNAELEQRVRDRTAELQSANQDLEAFSYSISHDLRAPLRGIEGFSRLLAEEHLPQLNADGQHYLRRVRANTQRMNQMIDDLLAFARLGRQLLQRERVALLPLIRQALAELRVDQTTRLVEWVVGDLPECQADPALLQHVFVNLLSNALKYTRDRAPARIEIGWQASTQAYFVRDNGVGFDMDYTDNLFGVFQRLHRTEDFEGTGVGLAIVKRIIERHGGRIWAEAAVDQGATFYFTLAGSGESR